MSQANVGFEIGAGGGVLVKDTTWAVTSITNASTVAVTSVAVPGSQIGDFVLAGVDQDVNDCVLNANVTAAGVVVATLTNTTGADITGLSIANLYLRVIPRNG